MKPSDDRRARARAFGEARRERRAAVARGELDILVASERALEALARATETGPFDRMLALLEQLAPPTDLLSLSPAFARGESVVRTEGIDEVGCALLATDAGVHVQIAFENHDAAPVWVVTCEQEPDGSISFVPSGDLAAAPRVPSGDALTFDFTPPAATTMRVVAVALRSQPNGNAADLVGDPGRLQEFGVVAVARFTLRVNPSQRE